MHEIYANGGTLEAVGQEYGLTRERVRQIFRDAGLPTIPLAERRRRATQQRAGEIVDKFRELHDQREVAKVLGLPKVVVDEVLRKRLPASELRKRSKYAKKYSNDELISMLRQASEALGGVLTKDDFECYARGRTLSDGRAWPTGQTHMLRFGAWRKALEAAGLRANPSSAIAGQMLFNEAQCIDALRHLARELGRAPTVAEYDTYARETNGALPCVATIRNRCGAWYDALAKAGI
jgi:hypothetical protein